jgi:hypothetical protein
MMNIFTRREKHVAWFAGITVILIILSGVDQSTLNAYEIPFMFFVVVPIGIYIAIDPERKPKANS